MGVSGNFSALRRLRDTVRDMDGSDRSRVLARAAQRMSLTSLKLVADEFRREKDPYDVPWKPLKHRRGKILSDTARMKHSVAGQAAGTIIRVTVGAQYAIFHQAGTRAHPRAERAAKQNARGRFVRMSKSGFLLKIRAHVNPGLPRRQILPEGRLGKSWEDAFTKDINAVVRSAFKKPETT